MLDSLIVTGESKTRKVKKLRLRDIESDQNSVVIHRKLKKPEEDTSNASETPSEEISTERQKNDHKLPKQIH